ncbi:MAG TPA: hypothetical protein VLS93_04630 [Anaeromyxobacteraceae bacterium]|nr:hypothetical protein [Anaeromyxobacteraceae bacterium]
MARVTTIPYLNREIVQIDFNGCTPGTYGPVIQEALGALSGRPPRTVLALTLLQNVRFDPNTAIEMERFARQAQPYLKANALVGIEGLKKVVFLGIKPLYRTPVELFDVVDAAKQWLAER